MWANVLAVAVTCSVSVASVDTVMKSVRETVPESAVVRAGLNWLLYNFLTAGVTIVRYL